MVLPLVLLLLAKTLAGALRRHRCPRRGTAPSADPLPHCECDHFEGRIADPLATQREVGSHRHPTRCRCRRGCTPAVIRSAAGASGTCPRRPNMVEREGLEPSTPAL